MDYIWELAIKAVENGIDPIDIHYKFGQPFSGYMELSFVQMNETEVLPVVEINPYYRYYSIFKELFEPNVVENPEIIDAIHDLAIHHLADIDVLMGMNKREYHIRFVEKELNEGLFGGYISRVIKVCTPREQMIIANNLLSLYDTDECIHLLKNTVKMIFPRAYIFSNVDEKDEIVLFLQTKETKQKAEKIEVIKYLFMPFKCTVEVYWENMFGIIGVPALMRIGEFLNY